ncbi:high affinity immunoglobulin alpha and immunoglobulin mu Fc receptor [Ctenodactylus gundi]
MRWILLEEGPQPGARMENALPPSPPHNVPAPSRMEEMQVLLWLLHTEDPFQMAVGWSSSLWDPPLHHGNISIYLTPLLVGAEFLHRSVFLYAWVFLFLQKVASVGKFAATAVHTLKGPRLVSGESGGAVTIQCHYTPVSVNRHQRKYWCRVGPPTGICHTIVSTNRYTHHGYLDRVTIADFPQRGLFVVRLSQLSLDDAGYYRCGIGHSNNMLFFRVNLTVSAGPASPAPTAPSAAGELFTASLGTASPAAKMWISEATPALGRQSTGWNRAAPAVGTSKTTASAKGRQTPGSTRAVAPVTGSITEGSIKTIALILESPASKLRSVFNTTRTFPEDENSSWILIPISTVLAVFLLVALVLLQRRLWSKRRPQEAGRIPRVTLIQMTRFLELNLQPAQLPNVKKELPRVLRVQFCGSLPAPPTQGKTQPVLGAPTTASTFVPSPAKVVKGSNNPSA